MDYFETLKKLNDEVLLEFKQYIYKRIQEHNMNTQNKPFDPSKPVQTRDGRKARIVDTNFKGVDNQKIIAIIDNYHNKKEEEIRHYCSNGNWLNNETQHNFDLINIPEKHTIEVYVNCYTAVSDASMHMTREIADRNAGPRRLACKKLTIEYTEGEGLE